MAESTFWDFKGAVSEVDDWFLMGSPLPVLLILGSYLYFVLRCGPKFMENKPPYELKHVLLLYNAFQVAFCTYIFSIIFRGVFEFGLVENGYCIKDQKIALMRVCSGHYLYFICKVIELLDTIFFVLRKKSNQITLLHVYHHVYMYTGVWLTLKYEPSYAWSFLGMINSFVHMVMYSYYGLSAFPNLTKYLWWKKYITKMQLIQFVLILLHAIWNWNVTTCPVSYTVKVVIIIHCILFIYLFYDFYIKNFIKPDGKNKTIKKPMK